MGEFKYVVAKKPTVYEYENYRYFLKDLLRYYKAIDPKKYSFRSLSKRAGFKSQSTIKLVIDGKRNLTHTSIFLVTKAFGLKKEDVGFFELLVCLNQSKNQDEKRYYEDKLRKVKGLDQKEETLSDMGFSTEVAIKLNDLVDKCKDEIENIVDNEYEYTNPLIKVNLQVTK